MQQTVFIGAGAGFAGDRTDAAGPVAEALARSDGPRFLIFETLAERTLALAQVERRRDPARGYNPLLEAFVGPVLRTCLENKIRIVSNFGAANPQGAAMRIREMAQALGFPGILVGVVEGDDLTGALSPQEFAARETGGSLLADGPAIVAANVYLGAAPIAEGLSRGADVVVTGRVADPSLALGPLIHAFGWAADDWDRLAAGTLVGHLLECGAQVTGGYFADPGVKDVPGMDDIGYPIAEVEPDGSFVITQPDGTGGLVDRRTVTEQVLYEIHDPAAYLTPDVVLDLTEVELREIGPDRVRLHGARGRPAPETLKATVCFDGGLLGEAEISYAGPNAAARARVAIDTVRARVARRAPGLAVRADAVGVVSILGDSAGGALAAGWRDGTDVRVRFAAAGHDAGEIDLLMGEVEALYCAGPPGGEGGALFCAGPAGGGGARRRITPRLASPSCLIERDRVTPAVSFVGGAT